MTLAGFIFMTVSLGVVISLTVFCYWRVLRGDSSKSDSE